MAILRTRTIQVQTPQLEGPRILRVYTYISSNGVYNTSYIFAFHVVFFWGDFLNHLNQSISQNPPWKAPQWKVWKHVSRPQKWQRRTPHITQRQGFTVVSLIFFVEKNMPSNWQIKKLLVEKLSFSKTLVKMGSSFPKDLGENKNMFETTTES